MIAFRCHYCNKSYRVSEDRIGAKLRCSCQEMMRVPRRSGGSSKYRTLGQRLIEHFVYGIGGAALGFLCARVLFRWKIVAGFTALGFLAGALGGERGVDWIGGMIRSRDPSL